MNKKGFTLIEIMAVVVVIGVICAIIFPKISNTISSSEINTSKLSAQELVDGLNNYVLDKKATLTPFDGCSYDFATSRNDCSDFEYSGKRPNEGILNVDGDGNVSGYVVFGEYRYDINNNKAVYSKVYVFDYIGNYQVFSVPTNGYYKIELWGSQGGDSGIYGGGYGAYTSGVISLSKNQNLYVYVGSKGTLTSGGYNGGGNPIDSYPGGGGATDIRYFSTSPSDDDLLWNSTIGLNSRIMVAGAGGGPYYYDSTYNSLAGQAGGLTGYPGEYYNTCQSTGGTQTSGGICTGYASVNGGFGYGGTGAGVQRAGGGGSGYYGGAARYDANGSSSAGGGGSSYISGHTGCVAVTSSYIPKPGCETGTTDNSCSIHFSGLKFSNTVMIDGYGYNWTNVIGSSVGMPSHDGNATMVGNTGDGFAKITYLGKNY